MHGRLRVGKQILGDNSTTRYKLVKEIGEGRGFSAEMVDFSTGRPVFLKTFIDEGKRTDRRRRRLFYNSELTSVTAVHQQDDSVDVPKLVDTCREQGFLMYEYIRGRSLGEEMKYLHERSGNRFGNFGILEGLTILGSIANTVGVVHQASVFHGDIEPANVMLEGERGEIGNRILVCDFELSMRAVDISPNYAVRKVRKEDVYATPGYVTPEHITCEIGRRGTDVFSLGVLAYNMLVPGGFYNCNHDITLSENVLLLSHLDGPRVIEQDLRGAERVIEAMCEPRLENRPTTDEVVADAEAAKIRYV